MRMKWLGFSSEPGGSRKEEETFVKMYSCAGKTWLGPKLVGNFGKSLPKRPEEKEDF